MRILVTGASTAGNTVAYWLGRSRHSVTVLERSPAFRDGGQNVDIRGAARSVIQRMKLDDQVKALNTGEEGIAFVDERNKTRAQFLVKDLGANGPTAELEILRGDLARTIYDAAAPFAEYRFGEHVTGISNSPDGVEVTLSSGDKEGYDLLIAAEGVGSPTRERVFPGENKPRYMDITTAYFTIPRGPTDSGIARWFNAPMAPGGAGGRSVFIRPDPHGTTRAGLNIQKPPTVESGLKTAEAQKRFIRDAFTGMGWETDRVLAGMDASDDFYFDVVRQVKMDRWFKDRVVLTGDAAWCATPLSGIGTSLAIVGAYVLAGELSRTATSGDVSSGVTQALKRYDDIMRPYVDAGQGIPKIVPRIGHPQSAFGIEAYRTFLGIVASPFVRDTLGKVFTPKADSVKLPDYEHLERA